MSMLSNLLIEFVIIMYKIYAFIEIQFIYMINYMYDLYYSDYYKVTYFHLDRITPYYIHKDVMLSLTLPSESYELVVWENNNNCVLINNEKEYKEFIKNVDILQNIYQKTPFVVNYPWEVFEYCKYTFSLIIVNINNKEYEIKLKTPSYNYYIVGNKINYMFILYYARKHLRLTGSIEDYNLCIVDHNSKFIENLTRQDVLLLELNDYKR